MSTPRRHSSARPARTVRGSAGSSSPRGLRNRVTTGDASGWVRTRPLSWLPGPASTSTASSKAAPRSTSVATPSAKRTGAQVAAPSSRGRSPVVGDPGAGHVGQERERGGAQPRRGPAPPRRRQRPGPSSRSGTRARSAAPCRHPALRQTSAALGDRSGGPATTQQAGPFTAASVDCRRRAARLSGLPAPSATASIARRAAGPASAGRARRPAQRVLQRRTPRPAWRPRTRRCCARASRAGRTPQRQPAAAAERVLDGEERRLASAVSGAAARPARRRPKSTSRRSQPSVRAASDLGAAVDRGAEHRLARRAARPCRAYWAPWPGNRNTTARRLLGRSPRRPACRRAARSAAAACGAVAGRRRHGGAAKVRRPAARCSATSARRRAPGARRRCAARSRGAPRRARAGVRADSTSSCARVGATAPAARRRLLEHHVRVGAADAERADAGARAAARRRSTARSSALTKNGLSSKSSCGIGRARSEARRDLPRARSASTALIRPATPAAASRWPMLVFTEPSAQKPRASVPGAERLGQRRDLDRVAERGAGAVRLDVADGARRRRRRPPAPRRSPRPGRRRSAR